MEFYKSRVYTAVDADELKVGSKVICADSLYDLEERVNGEKGVLLLTNVRDSGRRDRFEVESGAVYVLAYLVSEPEEKVLKWTDLKIGDLITYDKTTAMVTEIDKAGEYESHIYAGGRWFSDKELADWEKVED